MPVLSKNSIQRMVSMCGASMPRKLTRILARYGDHPDALREAGIAYAIDQISDLIAGGVDGIHLYTMNKPRGGPPDFQQPGLYPPGLNSASCPAAESL